MQELSHSQVDLKGRRTGTANYSRGTETMCDRDDIESGYEYKREALNDLLMLAEAEGTDYVTGQEIRRLIDILLEEWLGE